MLVTVENLTRLVTLHHKKEDCFTKDEPRTSLLELDLQETVRFVDILTIRNSSE